MEGLSPDETPECLKGEYKFDYEYTTQALLHRYDGILTRAALSRITGISQTVLGHYMTGYVPLGRHAISRSLTACIVWGMNCYLHINFFINIGRMSGRAGAIPLFLYTTDHFQTAYCYLLRPYFIRKVVICEPPQEVVLLNIHYL